MQATEEENCCGIYMYVYIYYKTINSNINKNQNKEDVCMYVSPPSHQSSLSHYIEKKKIWNLHKVCLSFFLSVLCSYLTVPLFFTFPFLNVHLHLSSSPSQSMVYLSNSSFLLLFFLWGCRVFGWGNKVVDCWLQPRGMICFSLMCSFYICYA